VEVRIDRTNALGPLSESDKNAGSAQADGAKGGKHARGAASASAAGGGEAASILSAKPSLVRKAAAAPEINAQAVAEARRLIAEGLLDTPAAARAVAETILSRGL